MLARLATKPMRHSKMREGSVHSAPSAHAMPAIPEPHTEGGARKPPRASAIPSACFCLSLSLVTAEPSTKYRHTSR